ncbi:Uncharacterized protein Rs2_06020 [Raphanus sativus]|nr:Uncharacterized protein Rs2_06020 [Raphanus sativus]
MVNHATPSHPTTGVLPHGALRDAHEHIGRLQRWNKAQDRTIEKLKTKCKALSKTVKQQAKFTSKILRKMADVLTEPRRPPQPATLTFPLTERQQRRLDRNPPIEPSSSGNKSPSLASSDDDIEVEEVQSQHWYGDYSSAGGYYTYFPPDDGAGPSDSTHHP